MGICFSLWALIPYCFTLLLRLFQLWSYFIWLFDILLPCFFSTFILSDTADWLPARRGCSLPGPYHQSLFQGAVAPLTGERCLEAAVWALTDFVTESGGGGWRRGCSGTGHGSNHQVAWFEISSAQKCTEPTPLGQAQGVVMAAVS